MNAVLVLTACILTAAALLLVVRLTVGPTILDRSVALDVLMAVTLCGTAVHAAHSGTTHALPLLLVLAGVGFVGAVGIARYASREDDAEADVRMGRGSDR